MVKNKVCEEFLVQQLEHLSNFDFSLLPPDEELRYLHLYLVARKQIWMTFRLEGFCKFTCLER